MKKFLIFGVALLAIAVAYWLISPHFITVEVNDEMPIAQKESSSETGTSTPKGTSSSIMDTPGHPASGEVIIIERTDEPDIVRFENYVGTNGPDLFVYLAKDVDAEEFVSLGRARGTEGNINYEVPEGIDVSEYRYVLTWCRLFGVLFDYAEIN